MFLETLKDGQQRFEEVMELASQLQPLNPADLAQLKLVQAAIEIAIKLELLKQTLNKNLEVH